MFGIVRLPEMSGKCKKLCDLFVCKKLIRHDYLERNIKH